jgi:enoyl-CoA hydratase/carnithine racemase
MERITTEIDGHVLLIGLNRVEKRNAFDTLMLTELADAYLMLEEDDGIRCAVLFAHGDHFTAGLDLGEIAPRIKNGEGLLPSSGIDPLGIYSDRKRTKPVVIAVQGICLTIGIELALASDIIIASEDTRFGQIEVRRGIFPFGGATLRLPQLVGWGNAMRYLLTGDIFTAETAYRIGMVQEVTEAGEHLDRAKEIAHTIAEQAPLGVRETLITAGMAANHVIPEGIQDYFAPKVVELMNSEDGREGFQSFIERRKAAFKGR